MGQPLEEKLEEASGVHYGGPWRGHTEEMREKTGAGWGQLGVRDQEEIKGQSVLNEARGRWGRGRCASSCFRPAAPASALASTGSAFRALTGTLRRRGGCFQMRPDAEKWGGGWPLWAWRE